MTLLNKLKRALANNAIQEERRKFERFLHGDGTQTIRCTVPLAKYLHYVYGGQPIHLSPDTKLTQYSQKPNELWALRHTYVTGTTFCVTGEYLMKLPNGDFTVTESPKSRKVSNSIAWQEKQRDKFLSR